MITPIVIDHIVLRTEKPQELSDFYCNVLGCKLERTTSDELGLTQLRAGNSLIDIVDVNAQLGKVGGPPPETLGNNVDHFCLQIAAVDEQELQTYLIKHGVELSEFQERYGAQGMGRSIYIKDLAGNTVELKAVKS
ncbi:VOC family protein [Colwelliaceae bacterium 6471]